MYSDRNNFAVSPWRLSLSFILLFALYQSAEGIGARLLNNGAVQAVLMIATVVVAWPVGRWMLRFRGYAAFGLEWRAQVPIWLATGLIVAIGGKFLALVVGLALGVYTRSPAPVAAMSLAGIATAILATFIASLAEDIITRGFWSRIDWTSRSAMQFVLATSAIYVLNHIYRLTNGPAEWFMLFCFGLAYATAMARTGSLWAAVGLHWGWNLANALVDSVVSLDATPSLTPYLSGAIHLLMALVILALPRKWSAQPDNKRSEDSTRPSTSGFSNPPRVPETNT